MLKMEGIQTLKGSWPWPSIRPYGISSCSSHRPLPIYRISFKLKKLFVDGRTDGRTDIFPLYTIRSTNNNKVTCRIKFDWWVNSAKQNRPDSNLNVQIDPDRLTGVESQVYDYRLYAWLSRWPECQVLVNITVRMMTNCEWKDVPGHWKNTGVQAVHSQ